MGDCLAVALCPDDLLEVLPSELLHGVVLPRVLAVVELSRETSGHGVPGRTGAFHGPSQCRFGCVDGPSVPVKVETYQLAGERRTESGELENAQEIVERGDLLGTAVVAACPKFGRRQLDELPGFHPRESFEPAAEHGVGSAGWCCTLPVQDVGERPERQLETLQDAELLGLVDGERFTRKGGRWHGGFSPCAVGGRQREIVSKGENKSSQTCSGPACEGRSASFVV